MNDAFSSRLQSRSEAKSLYLLLQEVERGEPMWTREDLDAILRHQLNTPLSMDLGAMRGQNAARIEQLAGVRGLTLKSFGDLLLHPAPPIDLLVLTKEFSKRNLVSPDSRIPREVARVLYYLSIAVARLRCATSISSLDDHEVRAGLVWCGKREWIAPEVCDVVKEALDAYPGEGAA